MIIRILTSLPGKLFLLIVALGLVFWLAPGLDDFGKELFRVFGIGVFLLAILLVGLIWIIWGRRFYLFRRWNLWLGGFAFTAAFFGLLAFFTPGEGILGEEISLGGKLGSAIIAEPGFVGSLRLIALLIIGMALVGPRFTLQAIQTSGQKLKSAGQYIGSHLQRGAIRLREFYSEHPLHRLIAARFKKKVPIEEIPGEEYAAPLETAAPEAAPAPQPVAPPAMVTTETPPAERWQLPPLELLNEQVETELGQADIEKRARLIEEALASYGVEAKVVQVNAGPAVTQFGVEPGWERKYKEVKERDKNGNVKVHLEEVSKTRVRVERITSLDKDLALALAAPDIRIEPVVPGKGMVGIEVPNSTLGVVTLRGVLESTAFQKLKPRSKLAIALGKAAGGEAVVGDLSKMPHLLIAGATGSGKTVCLNTIITSLLVNNAPEELQFLLVDPKRVELVIFNSIPHLMTPVIVEWGKAVEILKWLSQEMDSRYRKMAAVGVRNIETYNDKVRKPLPYLLLIIDELADLMMSRPEEVEPGICRLAQLARATGIHLVVATQRPSVDVVTGLIKANFPTRISFAVSSQVDSRTILDSAGAEKLLGRGDMLYLPPEAAKPKRLQGCFVSDQELEKVVDFWAKQRGTIEDLVPAPSPGGEEPLLEEARRVAREHKQISASFLQRQLRIGQSKAAQLMELLEAEGLVKKEESGNGNGS